MAIHLAKCQFATSSIDFLGFHINANGISPLPKKVRAIMEFPPPRSSKDLLGYLGASNYYRRSLPNVGGQTASDVLQPLYDFASKKHKNFTQAWKDQNMDVHYSKSKQLLAMAASLTHPDPGAASTSARSRKSEQSWVRLTLSRDVLKLDLFSTKCHYKSSINGFVNKNRSRF